MTEQPMVAEKRGTEDDSSESGAITFWKEVRCLMYPAAHIKALI